jgi:3-methyladenine DNA glycosylase Tag
LASSGSIGDSRCTRRAKDTDSPCCGTLNLESFDAIFSRAAGRKGGRHALEQILPKPKSAAELAALPGDRYLAEMTRAVFRSGFVWRIVDYKWPGFEEVFQGFDPVACAYQPDEAIESMMQDTRIIRHLKKLRSIRDNASLVLEIEREDGSFGEFIAGWPVTDIIGLHEFLKRRGSRLGGRTGQFFLRRVGKDTFVLARDVVGALIRMGVVDRNPKAKRDLRLVQDAFNVWHVQSGRPMCEISRVLSCSLAG